MQTMEMEMMGMETSDAKMPRRQDGIDFRSSALHLHLPVPVPIPVPIPTTTLPARTNNDTTQTSSRYYYYSVVYDGGRCCALPNSWGAHVLDVWLDGLGTGT